MKNQPKKAARYTKYVFYPCRFKTMKPLISPHQRIMFYILQCQIAKNYNGFSKQNYRWLFRLSLQRETKILLAKLAFSIRSHRASFIQTQHFIEPMGPHMLALMRLIQWLAVLSELMYLAPCHVKPPGRITRAR